LTTISRPVVSTVRPKPSWLILVIGDTMHFGGALDGQADGVVEQVQPPQRVGVGVAHHGQRAALLGVRM
jgi:hypothetical protein